MTARAESDLPSSRREPQTRPEARGQPEEGPKEGRPQEEREQEEGKDSVFYRKSKVLREKMVGFDYIVIVEQETFQGTKKGLGVKKFRQTVAYQWRRNGLAWKIYVVHIRKSNRF